MKRNPIDEINDLSQRYGRPETLDFFLDDVSFPPLASKRQREVAMAIRRPNGKILLQTKEFYPSGVFRLPTGGLKTHESIERGLIRETDEETALSVEIRDFIAILNYHSRAQELLFCSYLFLVDESGGVLREQEPKEKITGWREVDREQLQDAARQLRNCGERWGNWGNFRALVIDALLAKPGWI